MQFEYLLLLPCLKAFDAADMDKSGKINQAEFYVCLLKVYEEVRACKQLLPVLH